MSHCLEKESIQMYSIRVMHILELLKKLAEILRAQCQIDCIKDEITRKQINTQQAKSSQLNQPKILKNSGLSSKILGLRTRKLLFQFRVQP